MNKIVLHRSELDGFLTEDDRNGLSSIESMYQRALSLSEGIGNGDRDAEAALVEIHRDIGHRLSGIASANGRIHVYSFETPPEMHDEASRLIAKLRSPETSHEEFVYYTQRAYELMFSHVFSSRRLGKKRSIIQRTPVDIPVQNYAVHRIPDVDDLIHDAVMCVMLRGALLPSMIISKAIEDSSSDGYITPFELFRIKRDESRSESDMDYVLDLDRSFFSLEKLDGKDWIFADPMNATGGSLITITKFLKDKGVRPKRIIFINILAALKGALRVTRAIGEAEVYTLWMDPMLNDKAYILPGLGDAGDRLNGRDTDGERGMIRLIADYGTAIVNLYRNQVKEIEGTVLG